jgi:hypothetical protein
VQFEWPPEDLFADVGNEATARTASRGRNLRGQGERLRAEIVVAALRLLDELADDRALSLRAAARDGGTAVSPV